MKKIYTIIMVAMMALPTFAQITEANCMEDYQLKYDYPSYFCDCELQRKKNKIPGLPFDITVNDTTWYGSSSDIMVNGCSAYLYSECDVKMVIVQNCSNFSGPNGGFYKEVVVASNQARDVEPSTIKDLMEQNGVEGKIGIRIGILPAESGKDSRFICMPYNQGPHSTCEDCLPILQDMVFVSSNSHDVYVLTPDMIPTVDGLKLEWFQTPYECDLEITRGTCDGDPIAIDYFMYDGDTYEVPADVLSQARNNGENLYFHFYHNTGTTGRIRMTKTPGIHTGCDNITTPTTNARLVLGTNGMLLIERDGVRYTLTGSRL